MTSIGTVSRHRGPFFTAHAALRGRGSSLNARYVTRSGMFDNANPAATGRNVVLFCRAHFLCMIRTMRPDVSILITLIFLPFCNKARASPLKYRRGAQPCFEQSLTARFRSWDFSNFDHFISNALAVKCTIKYIADKCHECRGFFIAISFRGRRSAGASGNRRLAK